MTDDPNEEICHCFHVTRGKIAAYCRRERPRRASQISECLGCGTGCGGCVPQVKAIHAEICGDFTPPVAPLSDAPAPDDDT